jgi:hypothetical protein
MEFMDMRVPVTEYTEIHPLPMEYMEPVLTEFTAQALVGGVIFLLLRGKELPVKVLLTEAILKGVYGNGVSEGGYFTASAGAGVYGTGNEGVFGSGASYGGQFTASAGQGVYSTSTNAAGDSSIGKTYGIYATGNNFGGSFISSGAVGVQALGATYGVVGVGNNTLLPVPPANTGNAFAGTSYGLFAAQTGNLTTGCAAIYGRDDNTGDFAELNAWNAGTHYKVFSNIAGGAVTCAAFDLTGQKVLLHCPETPEFYYEDYGEGQLLDGKAHIDLDPVLAKNVAISEKHPLRVFIQLEDNETCKGVVVKNKTGSGFDVVELGGGTSNTPFEWHVVCNVKDAVENGTINHTQDLRFEKAPPAVSQAKN